MVKSILDFRFWILDFNNGCVCFGLWILNYSLDLFKEISFHSISAFCGGILFIIGSFLFILDAKR